MDGEHHCHPVAWKVMCMEKAAGSLGIRDLATQFGGFRKAVLENATTTKWVLGQILMAKYEALDRNGGQVNQPTSSHTWKIILQGYDSMRTDLDLSNAGQNVSGNHNRWTLTSYGIFTSKSMWQLLQEEQEAETTDNWKAIWKFKRAIKFVFHYVADKTDEVVNYGVTIP